MEPLGRLRMGMSYFTVSLWVFGLMSMPEALGFRVDRVSCFRNDNGTRQKT